MRRVDLHEVACDTSLFTPKQLHTRTLMAYAMNGWARWARANLASFPSLVRDHGVGLVVVGVHANWVGRFRFFDADSFVVRTSMVAEGDGTLVRGEVGYLHGDAVVATATVLTRPVALADESLAAKPIRLPDALMSRFHPSEIEPELSPRRLPGVLAAVTETGKELVSVARPFRVHRQQCEVADQWSFLEIPGIAEAAREEMVLGQTAVPELRGANGLELRSVDVELSRPLFIYDDAVVHSTAWSTPDGLAYVHRIRKPEGVKDHAVIVERMAVRRS